MVRRVGNTKVCSNPACKKAGQLQPFDAFHRSKRYKDGMQYWCKDCCKRRSADWQRRNRRRCREYQRQRYHAVNKYKYPSYSKEHRWRRQGIDFTLAAYRDMLEVQGDVCAICGQSPQEGTSLAVDHCHLTGNIRGLLCKKCNIGLGYFQDSPESLLAAAMYLRR